MLIQKIIRDEVEELKSLINNDSLTIPSLWECIWPGLMLMLWMAACPFTAFSVSGASPGNILSATGFSAFMGFIMLFGIANARGMLLAIPNSFRTKSKVFLFLSKKLKHYTATFMVTILLLAFLGAYSNTDGLLYLMPMMVTIVSFAFFFNADISRYKLSAITEVMKLVSASKHTITH